MDWLAYFSEAIWTENALVTERDRLVGILNSRIERGAITATGAAGQNVQLAPESVGMIEAKLAAIGARLHELNPTDYPTPPGRFFVVANFNADYARG